MLTLFMLCPYSQKICELLAERNLLERVMGSFSRSDGIARERNRKALTEMFQSIKHHHDEMMIELGRLQKDNRQVSQSTCTSVSLRALLRALQSVYVHFLLCLGWSITNKRGRIFRVHLH